MVTKTDSPFLAPGAHVLKCSNYARHKLCAMFALWPLEEAGRHWYIGFLLPYSLLHLLCTAHSHKVFWGEHGIWPKYATIDECCDSTVLRLVNAAAVTGANLWEHSLVDQQRSS